ncbi:hypothetical protein IV498_01145 [Paenarthrobacter sp. Z7-10]|uniref:hypothetical protein n=1 Tax=Paenarthrobacter sp. Z7-10 TaxID=2787635 RepID=UPI0022A8F31A|nr:hypothetical protein [Paenarthrobacter sp. Z7-10]MCZ2401822.1 hypothetical protein [Paenarthrobacter sp. Z7-10]
MKKLATSLMLTAVIAGGAISAQGAVVATGNWPNVVSPATGNWPNAVLLATGNWPNVVSPATGNWPNVTAS